MTDLLITTENAPGYLKFRNATNKVVSKGPEGAKITRITTGKTQELAQMFADFQNAEHKLAWLEDNKAKLAKYDINFANVFDANAIKVMEEA
jgi:hypothetical protein